MKRFWLLSMSVASLMTPPALADEPARLAPSTKWVLSYDDEACRLMRGFGSGDDAVSITFAKYAPGTWMEIMLGGPTLKTRKEGLRYRFLPEGATEEPAPAFFGANKHGTVALFSARLLGSGDLEDDEDAGRTPAYWREQEAARANSIAAFELFGGFDKRFIAETGSLGPAMTALDACLDDLVATWGYDPAEQAALRSRPKPRNKPESWIGPNDYPSEMLRREVSGVVRFRLDVDEKGAVRKCTVQSTYSDPAFQETTCRSLLRRASFKPALSADGEPVASFWATAVTFAI